MRNYGLSVILIITLILTSCGCNADITTKGVDEMEMVLLTKEELIRYIEKNLGQGAVDIEVSDLDGIDIDDFIAYHKLTDKNIEVFFLSSMIEEYLENLRYWKFEPFRAREIVSVESTEEEFESFKEAFFSRINASYEILKAGADSTASFRVEGSDNYHIISIGQTQNLEKYNLTKDSNGYYSFVSVVDTSGLEHISHFYYSKDSKYFMIAELYDETEYKWLEVFCGFGD